MMKFGQQDLEVHLPVNRSRNCLALRVIAGCLRSRKSLSHYAVVQQKIKFRAAFSGDRVVTSLR